MSTDTNYKLTKPHLTHNSTQPYITLVGWDMKMTLHIHQPTTTQTQCQQYLSCYWPNFDKNLKVGSLEHLEQIPITSVLATYVLRTFVHISQGSVVNDKIVNKLFWPNFWHILKNWNGGLFWRWIVSLYLDYIIHLIPKVWQNSYFN